MPGREWIKILEDLIGKGVQYFIITGGEPTLHPDFGKIITHLSQTIVPFEILTNGDSTIFTQEFCHLIASGHGKIAISVLGDADFYQKWIGGSYDNLINTIHNVHDAGIPLLLNLTLFQENLPNAVQTIQNAISQGFQTIIINAPLPIGRCIERPQIVGDTPDLQKKIIEIMQVCKEFKINLSLNTGIPLCLIPPDEYERRKDSEHLDDKIDCLERNFCIDPAGLIRPCTLSPLILGQINNLQDALKKSKLTIREETYYSYLKGYSK